MVEKHGPIELPTKLGTFTVIGYTYGRVTHLALMLGLDKGKSEVLVRIQSACRFGETFQALDCDCGSQLSKSMEQISREGAGIIVYLDQEGRGVGIERKLEAMHIEQVNGVDTVEAFHTLGLEADIRDYGPATQILHDLEIGQIRLLTNNPKKVEALIAAGISVIREPLLVEPNEFSKQYFKIKRDKLGHHLPLK